MTLTLKKKISLVALIADIIAVIIAISTSSGGVIYEEEKITLTEKGKGYLKEKIFGKEKQVVENKSGLKVDNFSVLFFGLISVIIGILSLFIREPGERDRKKHSGFHIDFNFSGAALAIGLSALLWNYILMAIVLAIVLYLFSSFMSGDIDIGF